jgi:hypothetical protein
MTAVIRSVTVTPTLPKSTKATQSMRIYVSPTIMSIASRLGVYSGGEALQLVLMLLLRQLDGHF